jgi:hypothetical protein
MFVLWFILFRMFVFGADGDGYIISLVYFKYGFEAAKFFLVVFFFSFIKGMVFCLPTRKSLSFN